LKLVVALIAFVFLATAAAPVSTTRYVAGSAGSGDPFFPLAGNGGYDVRHYRLVIRYDPMPVNRLDGRAAIKAVATENLYRFDLDLRQFLAVSRVTVDGKSASFAQRDEQELVITPQRKLKSGDRFRVSVDYSGSPEPIVDPDDAIEGWIPTPDGAYVVGEPQGSPGWYPVDDSPRDKATYDIAVSVPEGKTAIANGELVGHTERDGRDIWHWREKAPMAPYLATATNGTFMTRFSHSHRLKLYDAVDPTARASTADPPDPTLAFQRLDAEPKVIAFLSELYGPYPFGSAGGIVDWAPDVKYSLETQTHANYWHVPDLPTVVHELAHQWFGDAVTPARWADIWLNEGFATFSEWIYDERHGGESAQERSDEICAIPENSDEGADLWFPAPAHLKDASELFHATVYDRGAMTLQALRTKVGDRTFFSILRAWYAKYRFGNATTRDFIALAEHLSGQPLVGLFREWLYEDGRPAACGP
jgi:aminopeptidase N